MFRFVLFIVFILKSILISRGSHFLGGTITWRVLNSSASGTVNVVITQTYSWTYLLVTCTDAMIAANQFVPVGPYGFGTKTLNCISNCINGSTGYVAPSVVPRCTDISAPIGTTVGQRLDTVTLQAGDDFSAAFQDVAWRNLASGSNAGWSISTRINLAPRPDNGLYNNAPVATMMSPINIILNQSTIIHIPVGDPDGDIVRCRWANSSNGVDECGGVCPPNSLPPNTIIYPNCTIVIIGRNIGDWHAVTVMIEDFIDSTSIMPLSSIPVQFLVQVIAGPTCQIAPEIIGLPLKDSCLPIVVSQAYTTQLIAINHCGANVSITDIATLSFTGISKSNITMLNLTNYYKTLTWTPTVSQLGYQVICTVAIDSQQYQSNQYCFKFFVSQESMCACPGYTCPTTTSISTTIKPNRINWSLIGSLGGLTALCVCLTSGCLLWHYFCARYLHKIWSNDGIVELYHIERCRNPKCHLKYINRSTVNESVLTQNSFTYKILNEDKNSSIITNNYFEKTSSKINSQYHSTPKIPENTCLPTKKLIEEQKIHSRKNDKLQPQEKQSINELSNKEKSPEHVNHIRYHVTKIPLIDANPPLQTEKSIQVNKIDDQNQQVSKAVDQRKHLKHVISIDQTTNHDEFHHSLTNTINIPPIKTTSKRLDNTMNDHKQTSSVPTLKMPINKKRRKPIHISMNSIRPLVETRETNKDNEIKINPNVTVTWISKKQNF